MTSLGPDFLWGTATSAHQVEGGNVHNDWWLFEERYHRSGDACAFTEHFRDDLDHAVALGTNAFRFSLEWSRIEPAPGEHAADAAEYYDALIDACLERGLRPMLTLVQFTLPQWARAAGGWRSPETREAFRRHVRWIAERYGDRVDLFVTFNEPNVLANAGYVAGLFPPGQRLRFDLADRCLYGILRAHADAYEILHEVLGDPCVGVSPHFVRWTPGNPIVQRLTEPFNWAFLDALQTGEVRLPTLRRDEPRLRGTFDFVGVNHFMTQPATFRGALQFAGLVGPPEDVLASDMGWPVDADGLQAILVEVSRRYRKPIHVTENGVADALDALRPDYLVAAIRAVERAVVEGADVRGYFHWSLLDNFEWHEGFAPRFGLLAVDYQTQRRTRRPSFHTYQQLIEDARKPKSQEPKAKSQKPKANGQRPTANGQQPTARGR